MQLISRSLPHPRRARLTGTAVGTESAHEEARRGSHETVFDFCLQDITASARSIDHSVKLLR
jgi:hypothetical protein